MVFEGRQKSRNLRFTLEPGKLMNTIEKLMKIYGKPMKINENVKQINGKPMKNQ